MLKYITLIIFYYNNATKDNGTFEYCNLLVFLINLIFIGKVKINIENRNVLLIKIL